MASIYKVAWKTGTAYRVSFALNNKQKQKQFKSLRSAKQFVERLDTYRTQHRDSGTWTVETACLEWLAACEIGIDGGDPLEPETIKTYTGYVNNWLIPEFKNVKLSALTRQRIAAFRKELLTNSGLARITVKKILGALKSALDNAVLSGELDANVGKGVTIRLGGRHASRREIPDKKVFDALLERARVLFTDGGGNRQLKQVWRRYYPLMLVLCYCGLRLSEARGLSVRQLNFTTATLRVTQRADRAGRIGPPKSVQGVRVVHVPKKVLTVLKERCVEAGLTDGRHLLFASRADKTRAASPANIRKRMWVPLLRALELPNYGMHVCRHFYASRMIEEGANLKELSEAMGHADPAFTLRVYGHLFTDASSVQRRKKLAEAVAL